MSPILQSIANGSARGYGALLAAAGAATSFESIATVTVGSGGAANVEFTSIPSTYTHLQVRGIARSTSTFASVNVYLRFNSDTAGNYSTHYLTGNGSSASAGAETSSTYIYTGAAVADGSTASIFEGSVIDILDYKDTNKYKTARTLVGWDANGSGIMGLWSGAWRNTNAITTITLLPSFGNFKQYSHFALYGIKGA